MAKFQFNWFDIALVLFLVLGAFRGRKRGMSQELLPLMKWLALVAVCGFLYQPVAEMISSSTVSSLLSASYAAYLGLALVVTLVFVLISRQLGGKIVGSDMFGKSEYYLGILSGMVRFACILIFGLSLLNARSFTQKEIDARNRYVQQNYSNDFFPALFQVQDQVFRESLAGPVIHSQLGCVMIKPVPAESKPLKRKELDLPM
jgi:uncharacterized membrane protein required for colicin V production